MKSKKTYLCGGEVTEWPNVPVLKTGVGKPTGGSNPSFTATL